MEPPVVTEVDDRKDGILTSYLENTARVITSYLETTARVITGRTAPSLDAAARVITFTAAPRDDSAALSSGSQSDPQPRVVPFFIRKLGKEGDQVNHKEMELALRALEACCRADEESKNIVHQFQAVEVLVRILASGGSDLLKVACLDALDAVLANSSDNQRVFLECDGINKVTSLIRDYEVDDQLKWNCGEFMIQLIGHVNGPTEMPLLTPENVKQVLRKPLFDRAAPGRSLEISHNLPLGRDEFLFWKRKLIPKELDD